MVNIQKEYLKKVFDSSKIVSMECFLKNFFKIKKIKDYNGSKNPIYIYTVDKNTSCFSQRVGGDRCFTYTTRFCNMTGDIVSMDIDYFDCKVDAVYFQISKYYEPNHYSEISYGYIANMNDLIVTYSPDVSKAANCIVEKKVRFRNLDDYLEIIDYPIFDELFDLKI